MAPAAAERARRPTIVPDVAAGSMARRRAAAAATSADEAEVPETTRIEPSAARVGISTPGAATKTSEPRLLLVASASVRSVAATPTTPVAPAG